MKGGRKKLRQRERERMKGKQKKGKTRKQIKGLTWLVPIAEKYVAKPSLSQMSSHQCTETMLPNQEWANS
jgi:hypothetical protein